LRDRVDRSLQRLLEVEPLHSRQGRPDLPLVGHVPVKSCEDEPLSVGVPDVRAGRGAGRLFLLEVVGEPEDLLSEGDSFVAASELDPLEARSAGRAAQLCLS
jgi:hypothetical protein